MGGKTRFRDTFFTYATIYDDSENFEDEYTYINMRTPYNRAYSILLDPSYNLLPITRSKSYEREPVPNFPEMKIIMSASAMAKTAREFLYRMLLHLVLNTIHYRSGPSMRTGRAFGGTSRCLKAVFMVPLPMNIHSQWKKQAFSCMERW